MYSSYKSESDVQLSNYYRLNFPFDDIYKLLIRPTTEIGFTMSTDNGEEYWKRYEYFPNSRSFRDRVIALRPKAIHIGPMYNGVSITGKHLVFDVDISDYNLVRGCCEDKNLCKSCWKFCEVAANIINYILTNMYGFSKIMFVFSGRKGFHCWVLDEIGFTYTPDQRYSICKFFSNDVNLSYPMNIRIYKTFMLPVIGKLIAEQKKTDEFKEKVKKVGEMAAAFYFLWPRIDSNVTRNMAHMIKLPFCIHPVTSRMCLPFKLELNTYPCDKIENIKEVFNRRKEILQSFIPK